MIVAAWRLGAGVQLEDALGAEPVDPRLLEPHRARLGEVPHDAQRRQVVAQRGRRRAGARCASSSSARGRRHRPGAARWPRACASASKRSSSTTWLPASSPCTTRRTDRCGTAGRASTRQPSSDSASGGGGLGVDQRRVARHDQLRPAGRAARGRRLPRRRHRVGQRPVVDVGRRTIAEREHRRSRRATPGWPPTTTRDSASSTIAASSRAGSFGRHRLRDRPELPARDVGDHPVDRVGQRDGDEVAVLDAARGEVAGEAVGREPPARRGSATRRRTSRPAGPGSAAARSCSRRGNEIIDSTPRV